MQGLPQPAIVVASGSANTTHEGEAHPSQLRFPRILKNHFNTMATP